MNSVILIAILILNSYLWYRLGRKDERRFQHKVSEAAIKIAMDSQFSSDLRSITISFEKLHKCAIQDGLTKEEVVNEINSYYEAYVGAKAIDDVNNILNP